MLNGKYTTTRKLTDYVKPVQRIANNMTIEQLIAKRKKNMLDAYSKRRTNLFLGSVQGA